MSALRGLLLVATLGIAACPLPDPEPLAEDIPGFDPCRATHLEEDTYSLCPLDAAFPYDAWISGVIVGVPAFSEPAATLSFQTDDGPVWSLSALSDYGFALQRAAWSAELEADAPPIELRVGAPCDDTEHWFAVRSATTGELLAAAGSAATVTIDDWTVDSSMPGDKCPEPIDDCPCSEQCTVRPLRFARGDSEVDLYPSERALMRGNFEALTFESWTAVGESTCPDGQTEGHRWLLLGYTE
ncbi:MAG: hypothetical protein KDA24_21020 [Deltaproteobacteria bacterium]|nr:hypothetical protein [Deltaproteobacteria bacterium]